MIAVEDHAGDEDGMAPHMFRCGAIGRQFPDPHGAIPCPTGQHRTIPAEGHAGDWVTGMIHGPDPNAIFGIPNDQRSILRSGGTPLAIRAEGDAFGGLGMTRQPGQQFSGRTIPEDEATGPVMPFQRASQPATVLAPGQGSRSATDNFSGEGLATGGSIPQTHGAVQGNRGQQTPIGGGGDTADNIAVSGDERSLLELSGVGFFPPANVPIGCTGPKSSSLGGKAEAVE